MLVCKSRYTTNIIQHTKVSIIMTVCLFKMAYNGKSICEGWAKLDEKFNFDQTVADAFFVELNYKIIVERKSRRD